MSINKNFTWLAMLGIFGVQDAAVAQSIDIPHHPPPISQANVKPQSMIVMSNDHQLFYKAYTDFSDLDGDSEIDDTYKDSIRYYGYFDSEGCYEYDTSLAGGTFRWDDDTDDDFECDDEDDHWSGNFLNWATMTRMDILRKVLYGGKRHRDNATQSTILERASLPLDAHSFAKVITNNDTIKENTPFNNDEITICNTTASSGGPPLIRVAKGSEENKQGWPNWSANERWQCVWSGDKSQGTQSARPSRSDHGLGEEDYHARVEVCMNDTDTACESYPDSNYTKPVGLLHQYADSIDFGLVSGSYAKNKSGGVLRSNVRSFMEEFDSATGVFDANVPDEPGVAPEYNGIVSNIDAFRVSGYSYSNGQYAGDSCGFGTKAEDFGNGQCSSWGNPFAEMTLEAIRYLTGEDSPTSGFSVGSGVVEGGYVSGLTSPSWESEVSDNWCAAHSMVLINASEASFDANELNGLSFNVESQTNGVGDAEGLSGDYFVGETVSNANKQCTAKGVGGLGSVLGICPTAPGLEGSYNIAGLAKYIYENQVVLNPAEDGQGSNITSYSVRLSSNIPEIGISLGDDGGKVTIVPACESYSRIDDELAGGDGREVGPERIGKCAIVDFRVTEPAEYDDGEVSGEFRVVWEDSEFGGDYDSDLVMTLEYELDDDELKIETEVSNQSTDQIMGVGYILSGTDNDGFRAHSGINGYNRSEGCRNRDDDDDDDDEGCYSDDGNSEREYEISDSSSASFLRPPLYYAAKYGNDGVNNDGSPSAYFEVSRVGELVESLQEVLDQVLRSAARSGAGIGFSSSSGGAIFQTIYNNTNSWSGDLLTFGITDEGVSSTPIWSARKKMPPADQRMVIAWLYGDGRPFRMEGELEPYVEYLRGSAEYEQPAGSFRSRLWADGTPAPLGDIIGSQPYYVGQPNTYYVPQDGDTSYADFRTSYDERTPMVYVGANDGMLHGFNAETGVEELAYIPGLILEAEENYGALAELIDPDYQHRYYVDGSPTVLDVQLDNEKWISLLASGLGSGGKGIFALDVTDPDDFSEDNAENIALWEFGPEDDDELDGGEHLGYIYDRPSIVQMENGDHAVVFGNGYFSESGKASLYVLPVDAYDNGDDGGEWDSHEVKQLTPDHDANSGVNGLSSVSLLDTNSNGRVDLAYAGDLQGNVWRFDLRDESSDEWEDDISLLFSAKSDEGVAQVITTGLEVGRNPQGDIMVYFGTGGPEGESTPTSQSDDTLYALKDVDPFNLGNTLTRDDLDERVLNLTRQNVRYFPPGGYDNDIVENGWYIDLPSRERTVSSPLLRGDRIIFTTLIPGIGLCGAEDEGYLYELNAYKGNSFNNPVLDINGDGKVDGNDVINVNGVDIVPVGIKTKGALFTPVVRTDTDKQSETKISSNTAGELITLKERPVNLIPLGRASWRVLE